MLALALDGDASEDAESPADDPMPPSWAPPPRDLAHFELERDGDGTPIELGRGSMGLTYLATDRHLHIKVALKVIASAIGQDASARALFLREARAAARVRNSHVASVLYLSETPGNMFYAMEFVAGESLRHRMGRFGAAEPLLALDLAAQVARGLASIHAVGLIHRDLKPENILLVPATSLPGATPIDQRAPGAWHAKIIDFGLARAVLRSSDAASTVGFRGTALYASPEQCEVQRGLDGRSDLYSLGCILFELLAGTPPFRAHTHFEVRRLQVSQPPPLDRLGDVPGALVAVVARLLSKNPADRFPNAEALVQALAAARVRIGEGDLAAGSTDLAVISKTAASPPGGRPLPAPARRRRTRLVIAGAVALLLTGPLAWKVWPRGRTPLPPEKDGTPPVIESVAILPFSNVGGDGESDLVANGLHAEIVAHLARLPGLKVIATRSVAGYQPDKPRDLRRIAADLGVSVIATGAVRHEGASTRVSLEFVEPTTQQVVWSHSSDYAEADLWGTERQLTLILAERLRPGRAAAALERPATASPAACANYLRARALMGEPRGARASLDAAGRALTAAIEADPNWALAHAQLSSWHSLYYLGGMERTDERLRRALASAHEALRLRPGLPEAQLALGNYYRGVHDYARARLCYESALAAMPGDPETMAALGLVDRRQDRWSESAGRLLLAVATSPLDANLRSDAATTLIFRRRYTEASNLLEEGLRRLPANPTLMHLRAQLHWLWRGDLRFRREEMAARASGAPTVEEFINEQAELCLVERRFDDALATLRQSRFTRLDGDQVYLTRELLEAEILTQANRAAEAAPLWERAEVELAETASARSLDPRIRLAHALALAGRGRAAEAEAEAEAGLRLAPREKDAFDAPAYIHAAAVVFLRSGHPEKARQRLKQLLLMPAPYSRVAFDHSPVWAGRIDPGH